MVPIESVDCKSTEFPLSLRKIENLIHKFKEQNVRWWVAGGAVRCLLMKEPIVDYDVYSNNTDIAYPEILTMLKHHGEITAGVTPCTRNLMTPRQDKIQLITSVIYEDPVDCISNFDFTICAGAYDGEKFYHHERYFRDNLQKNLVLIDENRVTGSLAAMYHALKYISRGYRISREQFVKLQRNIKEESIDWSKFQNYQFDYKEICKTSGKDEGGLAETILDDLFL